MRKFSDSLAIVTKLLNNFREDHAIIKELTCQTSYRNETLFIFCTFIIEERLRWISMEKKIDLKQIVKNLSKAGVTVTVTKSRVELLKVLTPPTQTPQN